LISGGFVLRFFEDVLWKEPDLDIYVVYGNGAAELGHYLCERGGYFLKSADGTEDQYPESDMVKVSISL